MNTPRLPRIPGVDYEVERIVVPDEAPPANRVVYRIFRAPFAFALKTLKRTLTYFLRSAVVFLAVMLPISFVVGVVLNVSYWFYLWAGAWAAFSLYHAANDVRLNRC